MVRRQFFAHVAHGVVGLLCAASIARAQPHTDVLHAFLSPGATRPVAPLVLANDGNLYGSTYAGGDVDRGTIFRITPSGTLTLLHSFTGGSDGANPYGALIQAT